jgi:hypothetical protein
MQISFRLQCEFHITKKLTRANLSFELKRRSRDQYVIGYFDKKDLFE